MMYGNSICPPTQFTFKAISYLGFSSHFSPISSANLFTSSSPIRMYFSSKIFRKPIMLTFLATIYSLFICCYCSLDFFAAIMAIPNNGIVINLAFLGAEYFFIFILFIASWDYIEFYVTIWTFDRYFTSLKFPSTNLRAKKMFSHFDFIQCYGNWFMTSFAECFNFIRFTVVPVNILAFNVFTYISSLNIFYKFLSASAFAINKTIIFWLLSNFNHITSKIGDPRRLAVLLSKQHPLNLWGSYKIKSAHWGIAASTLIL